MSNSERELRGEGTHTPPPQARGSNRFRFEHTNSDFLSIVEVTAFTISLGALGYAARLQNYYALALSAICGIGGLALSIMRPKRS